MQKPVRVLMLSALPPPEGGVATWTETLVRRGFPPPFELSLIDTRVARTHWVSPARLGPEELRRTVRIVMATRRKIRSEQIAIMHINATIQSRGVYRNLICGILARRAGVPYVIHLRGHFDTKEGLGRVAGMRLRAYRALFDRAAAIIVLSEPSRDGVLGVGDYGSKTYVIPNYVDFSQVLERPAGRRAGGPLCVVFVGALMAEKGIFAIMETAAQLENVKFELIGHASGSAGEMVNKTIRQLGLSHRVEATGSLPWPETLRRMAASDVYVFPSLSEGFPMSVAEAMAAGLPVVATPAGAIPSMVDEGYGGFVVPFGDVLGMVAAISKLRDDSGLAEVMGRYNRAKALREYDFTSVMAKLTGVYRQVLHI